RRLRACREGRARGRRSRRRDPAASVSLASFVARAVPGTLAGRVLLIIFTGLVVAHAASFALFETERARAIERYAAADAALRITEYARNPVDVVGPPTRSSPRARIRWQSVAAVGDPPAEGLPPSSTFSSELRRLLAENLEIGRAHV